MSEFAVVLQLLFDLQVHDMSAQVEESVVSEQFHLYALQSNLALHWSQDIVANECGRPSMVAGSEDGRETAYCKVAAIASFCRYLCRL